MSMFFEPGAIDQFRRSLAQQSTWGALRLSTKLPGIGPEHNSHRLGSVPETKSVQVQTDGPLGSSDVRPSSKATRSSSARVSTTGSNSAASTVLGVVGASQMPPGRKKKVSTGPANGLDGLVPGGGDGDGDDASLGTMALSIDSLTISDQHSTVADTESYAFDGSSSIQSGSATFDDDDHSRGSKSTVSGYLPSIKSSATEGLPVRFKYRGPNVKHFGASSSSTATTMHNLAVNHKAFQSRMAELESWREQRMSRDKSKAREVAAAMTFVGANGLMGRVQGSGSYHDLQPSSAVSSAVNAALTPSAPNSVHSSGRSRHSRKGAKQLKSKQISNELDDVSLDSNSLASTL